MIQSAGVLHLGHRDITLSIRRWLLSERHASLLCVLCASAVKLFIESVVQNSLNASGLQAASDSDRVARGDGLALDGEAQLHERAVRLSRFFGEGLGRDGI